MKRECCSTITGAVDIGGTKIAVGVVDENGKVLAKRETPTAAADGFDAAMAKIAAMLKAVRDETGKAFLGVGIGCTGPVDPVSGEIGEVDFLPGWQGGNPVRVLSKLVDTTVAMENDADAATLAEGTWGSGRKCNSLICITIGTGIGGGILLNGKLYRGIDGTHPEIGHHVIDCNGPLCFCGAHGCWEVLARGPAIPERLLRLAPPDYPHRDNLTAKTVCELARAGEVIASAEVVREGRYLGIGIANLVTLYAPEKIVLGGNVMGSADLFLPIIRTVVRQSCKLMPAESIEVTTASLGSDAPLIGAGMVWRHRYEGAGDRF